MEYYAKKKKIIFWAQLSAFLNAVFETSYCIFFNYLSDNTATDVESKL